MPATCLANLTFLDLALLIILVKSTNHEAPHCAVSDRVLTSHGVFRYSPQKVKKEEEIT
jgi:hypothetical protein